MKRIVAPALLIIGVLCLLTTPALAQAAGMKVDAKGSAAPAKVKGAAPGAAIKARPVVEGGVEEGIAKVAPYDPTDTFGETYLKQTPQDAFLRLAEDYIHHTEIGARSIGTVPIWPRGPLKLGPIQIFPYLVGNVSWTNNVFQQEDDRASWYATEGIGFTGSYLFAGGRAAFEFGGDYRHFDYFNRDLSYSEWVAGLGFRYMVVRDVTVRAGVKWERLVDPISIEYRGKLRRDQIYPYVDVNWGRAFGSKINFETGMRYLTADFDNKARYGTANRDEWIAHVKAAYPFIKNTSQVYIRYEYRWDQADSHRINDLDTGHKVTGGIEGRIPITQSERLLGFIELGYRRDLYDPADTFLIGDDNYITTDRDRRKGTIVGGAGIRYLMGAKTSMELRLLRDLQYSTRGNYQVVDRIDWNVTHNVLRNLVARFGVNGEYSDPSNGVGITRWGVGAGARYILTDQVDLSLVLDYSRRNTARLGFDSDTFGGTFGVTVYFR